MKNYYRILQVDREAEQEVISAAYRRLAQKYHPDQNPQTEERMKEINEAYECLSNPDRRTAHLTFPVIFSSENPAQFGWTESLENS